MALRQQVWVDRSVQGVLVGRVLLYWMCAMLYVGIGSACFQYNQNPDWTLAKHAAVLFGQMWPWLPTVFLILPLAIYDVVQLSNRFVGPIYRLRKHFAALRQDIACAPLNFREEDYWRDLAAPINDMQAEILRLRSGVIELQQVASNTSAIMANLKATLPEGVAADKAIGGTESSEFAAVIAMESKLPEAGHRQLAEPVVESVTTPDQSITAAHDFAVTKKVPSETIGSESAAEVAIAPIQVAPESIATETTSVAAG